ncbi:MAG: hypothetical protein J6M30_01375 [Bacteroidales bacterium]|nr:hypothetical protein [Bacteroidales bacterium]
MGFSFNNIFGKKTANGNQQQTNGGVTIKGVTKAGNIVVTSKVNWKEQGFIDAGACGGNILGFDAGFDSTFATIKKSMELDIAVKDKIKSDIEKELSNKEIAKQGIQDALNSLENKVQNITEQIKNLKNRLAELKNGTGNNVSNNPITRLSFYIGLTILIAATLYLFIFYSSTVYSAFFKNFLALGGNLTTSMFNGRAVADAFANGVGAGLLVLFLPFIFLGLGFLSYVFTTNKTAGGYGKAVGLYVITFIFDVLLAYKISAGLYELQSAASEDALPPFSFSIAFSDIDLWIIIFGGFVSYIIWGLIFGSVMNFYQNMTTTLAEQKQIQMDIAQLDKQKDKSEQEINEQKKKLSEINLQINSLKKKLSSSESLYDYDEIKGCLTKYYHGWTQFASHLANGIPGLEEHYKQKMQNVDNWIESDKKKFE